MSEPVTTMWSLIGQIAMIMLAGGGLVLLEQIRQKAMEWYKERKLHPIARSVLANKEVNSLLIELRAKTNADRASVFLFHNGQTFSNKNPLWRVSSTQECCKPGVSHEIASMQNILASLYWDGIAPLFGDQKDCGVGISAHMAMNGLMRMYRVNVHELGDTYYTRASLARGIKTLFVTPLVDSKREIVGFIALDFCGEDAPPAPEEIITTLVESAGLIHFALTAV